MLPAEAFGDTVYKTFCHDRLESDLRKVKFCDKITNFKLSLNKMKGQIGSSKELIIKADRAQFAQMII